MDASSRAFRKACHPRSLRLSLVSSLMPKRWSSSLESWIAPWQPVIANGAAARGQQVTRFSPFWSLNVLRWREDLRVVKTLIERMFGWMLSRGADRLKL
jgi:hypothetical protein